jgi:hypothetical protein
MYEDLCRIISRVVITVLVAFLQPQRKSSPAGKTHNTIEPHQLCDNSPKAIEPNLNLYETFHSKWVSLVFERIDGSTLIDVHGFLSLLG